MVNVDDGNCLEKGDCLVKMEVGYVTSIEFLTSVFAVNFGSLVVRVFQESLITRVPHFPLN